jgi:5'-methylthioadenosine phosphorylase
VQKPAAEIGVFGGSGFYSLMESARHVRVDTPYGEPSDQVALGEIGGRSVAFIPRHGSQHSIPPHAINYRANLAAFQELGVTRVISPCAAGSLDKNVMPGDFVICDQLVDRTTGRKDTFHDGPQTVHISFAEPYCRELRPIASRVAESMSIRVHSTGTMVVIPGPRFSTAAESTFYSAQGWTVIGMTQYPEAPLARELEMCFLNISLVTDYDAGVEGVPPVTADEALRVFRENTEKLRTLVFALIEQVPTARSCPCGTALEDARL